MAKSRLVVDTNVFVSGLIVKNSPPAEIFRALQKNKAVLLINDLILDEYLRVLKYPKIFKYPHINEEFIRGILNFLIHEAEQIQVETVLKKSPDPDDNKFLEVAVDGKADLLITGDKKDLLFLKEVNGIPIVTARKALSILKLQ